MHIIIISWIIYFITLFIYICILLILFTLFFSLLMYYYHAFIIICTFCVPCPFMFVIQEGSTSTAVFTHDVKRSFTWGRMFKLPPSFIISASDFEHSRTLPPRAYNLRTHRLSRPRHNQLSLSVATRHTLHSTFLRCRRDNGPCAKWQSHMLRDYFIYAFFLFELCAVVVCSVR